MAGGYPHLPGCCNGVPNRGFTLLNCGVTSCGLFLACIKFRGNYSHHTLFLTFNPLGATTGVGQAHDNGDLSCQGYLTTLYISTVLTLEYMAWMM